MKLYCYVAFKTDVFLYFSGEKRKNFIKNIALLKINNYNIDKVKKKVPFSTSIILNTKDFPPFYFISLHFRCSLGDIFIIFSLF